MHMNSYHKDLANPSKDEFSISYVPHHRDERIYIHCAYKRRASRKAMKLAINDARKLINLTAKQNGWQDWVEIGEKKELVNRLESLLSSADH